MKLIDADLLEKEIYKWMPKDQETWMDSDIPPIENLVVSIMMTIQEQPTVDAVPVIHCRDCKHRMHDRTCIKNMKRKPDDGYCDEGERNEW